MPAEYELQLVNKKIIPDVSLLKQVWLQKVKEIFDEATLSIPVSSLACTGGKEGKHSEHLDLILNELQSVARAHPAASW